MQCSFEYFSNRVMAYFDGYAHEPGEWDEALAEEELEAEALDADEEAAPVEDAVDEADEGEHGDEGGSDVGHDDHRGRRALSGGVQQVCLLTLGNDYVSRGRLTLLRLWKDKKLEL